MMVSKRDFAISHLDRFYSSSNSCAVKHWLSSLVCCAALAQAGYAETEALIDFQKMGPLEDWTFEFGVALMTENDIDDFIEGVMDIENGDAGATTYQFTATKQLRELPFELFGNKYTPLLEMPLCLELVDENARDPFLVSNASLQLRWTDFPWNRWVRTTFAAGLGLSYSSKIYAMDKQRHPGEERSHLKFNLPIQMSFALPDAPQHQVILYISHHSGGFGTFDRGGVNSVGISYAYSF
jgi:hypothetical protein